MNKSVSADILLIMLLLASGLHSAVIIDHTCANLQQVPAVWIESVQDNFPSHYAHTSHGGQLTYGLEFIEADSSFYDYARGISYLPSIAGAWCIFDGQETESYISPDLYWETAGGMDLTRDVLDNNPEIETSMWSWCSQLNYYGESEVQAYLDSLSVLETEYPDVTFIYMTGNAQGTGSDGYNRWQRNEQIRDYCSVNDKVLYDFADLDCWWYNTSSSSWELHTYTYSTDTIPAEHPQFYGNEYGHTTAESCVQKGEALWYMMAVIAGWQGTGIAEDETGIENCFFISAANPSYGSMNLTCSVPETLEISINVYSCDGRLTGRPFRGELEEGSHNLVLDELQPGLYLVVMTSDRFTASENLIIL